jgi:hypothetical protein
VPAPGYRQRHTPGRYWSATTGQLVEYESYLESKWLTLLDFDPAVVAFASQPLEFDGVDGQGAWSHIPDARRLQQIGLRLSVLRSSFRRTQRRLTRACQFR